MLFAIIISSTRASRIGPSIARYVHETLTEAANSSSLSSLSSSSPTFEIVDLKAQNLPLFDEPTIPAWLPAADPTPHYGQPHTRAWSATIRKYDGVVFVTPQYNWSVPASLKNAVDYLCHEWNGKPVGIVSYGGRGGGKAADHLRDICQGLHMAAAGTSVALTVPRDVLETVAQQGPNGVDVPALARTWRAAGEAERLSAMLGEMLASIRDS